MSRWIKKAGRQARPRRRDIPMENEAKQDEMTRDWQGRWKKKKMGKIDSG